MGNDNALAELIRGDSDTWAIAAMAATFWAVLRKSGVDLWLGRVISKLHIEDRPARPREEIRYKTIDLDCSEWRNEPDRMRLKRAILRR